MIRIFFYINSVIIHIRFQLIRFQDFMIQLKLAETGHFVKEGETIHYRSLDDSDPEYENDTDDQYDSDSESYEDSEISLHESNEYQYE